MSINVGQAVGYLDLDTSGFQRGFKSALQDLKGFMDKTATLKSRLDSLGSAAHDVGSSLTKEFTIPLAGVGAAAIGTAANFESAMSEVAAISGATGDDLTQLTDKAKEMGATTKFSASESASALKYMAMAGWDTESMLDGISGVMQLAAASGEDLASTSDIVTDAMTAFGLSADQSTRFADVLAQTANRSNTSVALMGETFKYVAPVAGALGYSIEDTSVAIGLMANSGIKGSQAGTSLKNVLTNLAKPTDQVQSYMDKLNISLTDSAGNVKPLNQLLNEMRNGFNGLTDAEKAEYAAGIAGKEGMSGLLAIVNSSQTDFDNLTEAINNSNGAAETVADTMMDNLGGQLTILKSTVEGLAISFGDILLPVIKTITEKLQQFATWLNGLDDDQKQLIVTILSIIAAIGPVLLIVGKVISTVTTVMSVVSKLKSAIGALFNLIMANPLILIVVAIAGVVAALIHLYKTNSEFKDFVDKAWNKIKEVVSSVVDALVEFFTVKLPNAISSLIDWFKNLPTRIKEELSKAVEHVKQWGSDIVNWAQTELPLVIDRIIGFFKELPGKALEIGKELISGLANGITEAVGGIGKTIKSAGNKILQGFKDVFDIHSPSKETAKIGAFVAEGLAEGIEDSSNKVLSAVQTLGDSVTEGTKAAVGLYSSQEEQITSVTLLSTTYFKLVQVLTQLKDANVALIGYNNDIVNALKLQAENYGAVTNSIQEQVKALKELQIVQSAVSAARMIALGESVLKQGTTTRTQRKTVTPQQSSTNGDTTSSGNTFIFNSPKAINPTTAAKLLKQTAQQLAMDIK